MNTLLLYFKLMLILSTLDTLHACVPYSYSTTYTYWDCKHENLTKFPPNPQTSFQKLDLGHNLITEVSSSGVLQYDTRYDITHLLLNNNKITRITKDLTRILPNLEVIDLRYNFIKVVKTEFANSNINQLFLDGNDLEYISVQAFRNTPIKTVRYKNQTFTPSELVRFVNNHQKNISTKIDDNTHIAIANLSTSSTSATSESTEASTGIFHQKNISTKIDDNTHIAIANLSTSSTSTTSESTEASTGIFLNILSIIIILFFFVFFLLYFIYFFGCNKYIIK